MGMHISKHKVTLLVKGIIGMTKAIIKWGNFKFYNLKINEMHTRKVILFVIQ